jgi:hypothetical protein
MSGYDEHPLCVTLESDIAIPGPTHEPAEGSVFRARERSVGDETTWFFGLNIGPEHAAVEVSNDNIRAVAHLTSLSEGTENSDSGGKE